jgi:glycosyltransferase involved in cell wall biosynthesis
VSRIVVATSHPPFAEGGHLVIAHALVDALRGLGHTVDFLKTPQNRFGRQASAYLATRLIDVGMAHDGQRIDQIITMRYPSYALKHEAHVCWLNHPMREYYDLWERFSSGLSWKGRLKEGVRRRAIHAVDRHLLTRNVTKLVAQSRTVQGRLARWGRLRSEVLYPPPPPRPYRLDGYGDYLFAVSRLHPLKRMDLVVQALASPRAAGIRCVIAGDGEDAGRIAQLIAANKLGERVRMIGRVGEAELVEHLAKCRAVCFPPHDEDYGFVTVEAFAASKPVITCLDSGGPAELVQDGVNGYVVAPTPEGLAAAMQLLMEDKARAERMGEAGHAVVAGMTWPETARRLVVV